MIMGWDQNNFTAKPYLERLHRIAKKLQELQKVSLEVDKNKLEQLRKAMEATIEVRERKDNNDMDKETPITAISSRASQHYDVPRAVRYKRRGSPTNS